MNVVLLSPNFPPNVYNFATALRGCGVTALGIGDMPFEGLRPELRSGLTEYYRVHSMEDYEQLVRACGHFTHRYGKLDRLESHNEYWLETDAKLREDFNIVGPRPHDMHRLTRKSKMKSTYLQAGGHAARGAVMATEKAARKLVAETGYPVVAKPDRGVGAAATFKINNDADLERFFAQKPAARYFIEEFVQGELVSFDGLVDQKGRVVFYTSHHFSQGIMDVVNNNLDMFYYSLREIPADLTEAGFRAVDAFRLRERFFHIEFFRTSNRLLFLELNMRPPGGLTVDMFNYANDIDLYQGWADVIVDNSFRAHYERPYHCAYVGRKTHRRYMLSHEEVLESFGRLLVHHQPIDAVLAPALGDYGYLLRSPELPVVKQAIDRILAVR